MQPRRDGGIFGLLKHEPVHAHPYSTQAEAGTDIFEDIEEIITDPGATR